jgi:photosystem II stability/assembly factor-like uncharacterized protein
MRGRGSARRWGKPVTDPQGGLEAWLTEPVQPMLPRPGTFDRVSREARHRRTRRMALSVAGAAAAAVAAVVIPQVAIPALEGGPATPVSAAHGTSAPAATAPAGSLTPTPAGTGAAAPAAGPVPPPLSVTFVGTFTGWVLGQNRAAGQCDLATAAPCLTLARTDTSGATWRPAGPPPAHGPDGGTGVSQIRFLDRSDGWAFGPQLWSTHDSGRSWTQIATGGMRVTALESQGTRVFAVWAHCTGTGPRFTAQCTGFTLYSSPAGSDQWQPVPGAAAAAAAAGGSAALLLAPGAAYLLLPDGSLLSGPLTGAPWPAAGPAGHPTAPCRPGPPQAGGQPSGALLAVAGTARLVVVCTGPSGGGPAGTVYSSVDGGRSWQRSGIVLAAGTARSLSGSLSGRLLLATSAGIETSADGGADWTLAGGTRPSGGFGYVGMTTASQGFAIPAGPGQHAVWFTYDGGRTWAASPVSG